MDSKESAFVKWLAESQDRLEKTRHALDSGTEFHALNELLWAGKINENDFVAQSSQIGIPVRAIDAALNELREYDGVL